jgi:acyl-CoA reductase-like NAD-dependent aldehyde dehydrogenase
VKCRMLRVFIEWFAAEARRTYGDVVPAPVSNKRLIHIKQPVGVAGMITPVRAIGWITIPATF